MLPRSLLRYPCSGADLGIVFDTDVDRSAVVASNGEPINSNRYIGLMSYIALRWGLPPKRAGLSGWDVSFW